MPDRVYALGRDCTFEIDGVTCNGVSDVVVRERTTDIDATGMGHSVESTVAVARTYEISVTFSEIGDARALWSQRFVSSGSFRLPRIFAIQCAGGIVNISERFTLHDIDADEPLDGIVQPRFFFRQWGHA